MSRAAFGEHLTQQWLNSIPTFHHSLWETSEKYMGHDVFLIDASVPGRTFTMKVYRYVPLNSEWPVLAFVPEN